jgi:chromate transporter
MLWLEPGGAGGDSGAWFDEKTYADLVALCQFLPGPASSQVGIAIGIIRAAQEMPILSTPLRF